MHNIKYDYKKAQSITSSYITDIDSTVNLESGICYDFSAVYAGMLRSVGIPTKLIMGTSLNVNGYHSWNEVYLNGDWRIVDTSYDSEANVAGKAYSIYKLASSYSKEKEF